MKKVLLIIVFFISALPLEAQQFSSKPTWSQDFRSWGRKPLDNWNVYKGSFDIEEQYYTDSIGNLYTRYGCLHIKATLDKRHDKKCSSARISSRGAHSFLYGKLEIRARIQTGKGIFPAIWMLRENHSYDYPFGEIDLMEYIDCFDGGKYCTTIHLYDKRSNQEPVHYKHYKYVETDMSRFHIYGLEWTPSYIKLLLDREEVFHLEKKEVEVWPFDEPYLLILNVAYGSWGGQCGMDDSIFPREMLVDWIRYYQLIDY